MEWFGWIWKGNRGRLGWCWMGLVALIWTWATGSRGVAVLAWAVPGMLWGGASFWGREKEAWVLGWVGGTLYYWFTLSWLLKMPFPFGAVVGWGVLGLYLGLYVGAWIAWCQWSSRLFLGENPFWSRVEDREWGVLRRGGWALGCGLAWGMLEEFRGWFLSGFPWNYLGTSQYRELPFVQSVRLVGVSGLSALMTWVSMGLILGLREVARSGVWQARSGGGKVGGGVRVGFGTGIREVAVGWVVVLGIWVWGTGRILKWQEQEKEGVEVAVIQPSVPQESIWDDAADQMRFDKILQLSRAAARTDPEWILWPESSIPGYLRYDQDQYQAIRNLLQESGKPWLILAGLDAEPRDEGKEVDYLNAAFVLDPEGAILQRYVKRRLVIFGEYIPLVKWLPFLKWFTPIRGGLKAGGEPEIFQVGPENIPVGVLICFEDIFWREGVERARRGARVLVNLTNDGWFGESEAQWQHAINSGFRAVETGRPLIRCTNNGLSLWVDSTGKWHETYYSGGRDIYGEGFKRFRVEWSRQRDEERPFYMSHSFSLGWGALLALGGIAGWIRNEGRAKRDHLSDRVESVNKEEAASD